MTRKDPYPPSLHPDDHKQFVKEARRALVTQDWETTYSRAKTWAILGGAFVPETWLVYSASGLFHRQPKTAVHTLDMALSTWIEHPADRSILLWGRALIVHRWAKDPKTALHDFTAAQPHAPAWASDDMARDVEVCLKQAATSRKRTASVTPAPAYLRKPRDFYLSVNDRMREHLHGTQPTLWPEIIKVLARREED